MQIHNINNKSITIIRITMTIEKKNRYSTIVRMMIYYATILMMILIITILIIKKTITIIIRTIISTTKQ